MDGVPGNEQIQASPVKPRELGDQRIAEGELLLHKPKYTYWIKAHFCAFPGREEHLHTEVLRKTDEELFQSLLT